MKRQDVMLFGSRGVIESSVTNLLPRFRSPVAMCDGCISAAIWSVRRGTLVVWNADRLSANDQLELLRFLADRNRCTHVVAVVTTPLLEGLQRGAFFEELIHRLHPVILDSRSLGTYVDAG